MRRLIRLITRFFQGPLFFWRRMQYAIGLRKSRLVSWESRPDAPYRALVFGLEEDMWEHFDAAYPEYDKVFAPSDTHLAELRSALGKRHMALLVFDNAPKRRVDAMTAGLRATTFYASYAPIPVLEDNEGRAVYGFLIDTVRPWLKARRETEIEFYLEYFHLNERQHLIADGEALKSRLAIPTPAGDRCLIVEEDYENNASILEVANTVSLPESQTLFRSHLDDNWYSEVVIREFLMLLTKHKTVVVKDSPLGLLACLAGHDVITTGRPFWAGYGLTQDTLQIKRRRSLTGGELVAIIMFLLSRYVDAEGNIVDLTKGLNFPNYSELKG